MHTFCTRYEHSARAGYRERAACARMCRVTRAGPVPLIALAGLCLLAGACFSATTAEAPTSAASAAPAVPVASTAPLPTMTAEPPASAGTLAHLPLSLLSPSAAEEADKLGENVGIAVYYPGEGRIYEYNARVQFELVSVVKVPVLLTLLDRAATEHRRLTEDETRLATKMIEESDNDATTALWVKLGGAKTVQRFLDNAGITGASIDPDDWGDSTMSASAGAGLLARLIEGEILDAPGRAFAMQLMERVDPAQSWGATVSSSFTAETGTKNGWYPEDDGWVLNSFGYALPDDGSPEYTIAIFSRGHPSYADGIHSLEVIASLINLEAAGR